MNTRKLIAVAGLALCLSACIHSLNPFYTEKDLVFDARLTGTWREKSEAQEAEVWRFEKTGDKAYKLVMTDKDGKQGEFAAHLFKLKQDYFLDLIPNDCNYATNQTDLVGWSMFPGHLLARVPQIEQIGRA